MIAFVIRLTLEQQLIRLLPKPLKFRFCAAGAHNKSIMRGIFWVALFVGLAKGIAFFKEIVVASRYGTSGVLEGYLLVFNLAGSPVSLIYSVMRAALVPWLVRLSIQPNTSLIIQRRITAVVWLLALVVSLAVALLLPFALQHGWLGLAASARVAAAQTLPWMALRAGLGIVASWHACQLMSAQLHANSFLEAMPALFLFLAVVALGGAGIYALVWGTIIGFLVQAIITATLARAAGFAVRPGWPKVSSEVAWPKESVAWLFGGSLVLMVGGIIEQLVLARLPEGSLAGFGYANRVTSIFLALSTTVMGRALLPVLSAISESYTAYRLAQRWAQLLLGITAIATIILVFSAETIVTLLYQRGAFDRQATESVSGVLRVLLIQFPFYVSGIVWVQWWLTRKDGAQVLFWVSFSGLALKLTIMLLLVHRLGWGGEAVAWGVVFYYLFVLIALRVVGKRRRVSA